MYLSLRSYPLITICTVISGILTHLLKHGYKLDYKEVQHWLICEHGAKSLSDFFKRLLLETYEACFKDVLKSIMLFKCYLISPILGFAVKKEINTNLKIVYVIKR